MKSYVGKLIVYTGSMFSDKTTSMLQMLRRFSIAGYKVKLFKPMIDNRYSDNEVVTHDKINRFHAENIEYLSDILDYDFSDTDVIGIDEFQFLKTRKGESIVELLEKLLRQEKTIVIAGLDIDYQGKPFENVKEILPVADYVYKIHAVCTECGDDAWISHRIVDISDRIVIGAENVYKPLCRKCYYKLKSSQDCI